MKNFDDTIGGVNFLVVGSESLVVIEDFEEPLTVEDVLKLSEFVAAAYEALTGAPYEHEEVGPNGIEHKPGYAVGGIIYGGALVADSLAAGLAPRVIVPEVAGGAVTNAFAGMRFPQLRLERGA